MTAQRRVILQGWRFVPHSYAIINQFHCLELLQRPELALFHQDAPRHSAWQPMRGLLDPEQEAAIGSIPSPPADAPRVGDVIFRQSFPHDCTPAPAADRVCVNLTAEQGIVPGDYLEGADSVVQATERAPNLYWVAPSSWSRAALLRSGAPDERVIYVPHGVMPEVLHPAPLDQRKALRREKGVNENFVFLNIGAMTTNKGLTTLLKGLAAVASRHSHVRLLLKGLDRIYPSRQMLLGQATSLSPAERALVEPRMLYLGDTLSFRQMATLYHMADAYVTPYRAEGFNMPALEAAACGLPVICTRGGPTDDFTTEDFALRIDSTLKPMVEMGAAGFDLIPSVDSLIAHMMRVVEDDGFRDRAWVEGPKFVNAGFTWKLVVDRLLAALFSGSARG